MALVPREIGSLLGGNLTTRPKTIFGKLMGGISGRTANANDFELAKINSENMVAKTNTPLSVSASFGSAEKRKDIQPLIFGGLALIAIVAYFRKPKRRR